MANGVYTVEVTTKNGIKYTSTRMRKYIEKEFRVHMKPKLGEKFLRKTVVVSATTANHAKLKANEENPEYIAKTAIAILI